MAGLPPLRYLRKSTALLALIFVFFFFHRLFVGIRGPAPAAVAGETLKVQSVLCRNIVGGAPFGVDSVFVAGRNRVYIVSTWSERGWGSTDSLRYIWYREGEAVQDVPCVEHSGRCFSSMAPELLGAGDWSVDLVWGRRLLASRQFRVLGDGP